MVYEHIDTLAIPWPIPRFEQVDGVSTAIYEAGEGEPVLLIHGCSLAVDARLTWFRLLPELARFRHVVAYDQPGFGLSEVPADRELPDRLERTDHARGLVRLLGIDAIAAIGHSEGGFIATRLALDVPSPVSRLVVVTSGATSPSLGGDLDTGWQAAASRAYDYIDRSVSEDHFVSTEERLGRMKDPNFEAILRANYRRDLGTGHVEMFRRVGRNREDYRGYTAVQEREIFPFLDRLRAPSRLIWGALDQTVPVERGEALVRRMPGAKLDVIGDAGHWVMHDAQATFNERVTAAIG